MAASSSPPGVVRSAARVAVGVYLGMMLAAAALADGLIFQPPPASYTQELPGLLRLETSQGDTVAALHLPAAESSPGDAPTVLFAHGNAEDLGDLMPYLERYRRLGASVMAFDYPGYGLSSGRPSEQGAYAAADAAYRYLVGVMGVPPRSIVPHGRSLGGGVLVDLAARSEVGALIVESSFVSAYRVMTRWRILPMDQFQSLRKLSDVSAPVFVIHGTRDEVIAPWHGRRLAEAVPESRRTTLWVEGAMHNDLVDRGGTAYWEALQRFLSSTVSGLRAP